MTKKELIEAVVTRGGMSHLESRLVIDLVLGSIADGLIADGMVSAFPLGSFNVTYSGKAPHGVGFMPSNAVMTNVRALVKDGAK